MLVTGVPVQVRAILNPASGNRIAALVVVAHWDRLDCVPAGGASVEDFLIAGWSEWVRRDEQGPPSEYAVTVRAFPVSFGAPGHAAARSPTLFRSTGRTTATVYAGPVTQYLAADHSTISESDRMTPAISNTSPSALANLSVSDAVVL